MSRRSLAVFAVAAATATGISFASTELASAAPVPTVAQAMVTSVTVAPGDSLSSIGARVGFSWSALASYNRIANPNLIYPGQVILIPSSNGSEPVAPTQTAPAKAAVTAKVPTTTTGRLAAPTRPAAAAKPAPAVASSGTTGSGVWSCIARHESGTTNANTGNGYYGYFQFAPGSWRAAGGTGLPTSASYAQQLQVAQRLQQMEGWGAWPQTSRMCGA